jgi:hypothetical protein
VLGKGREPPGEDAGQPAAPGERGGDTGELAELPE